MGTAATYRVEYQADSEVIVLDHLAASHSFPYHRSLDPYLTHLHLAGRSSGELRLVDVATGRIVARRQFGPTRRWRSQRGGR